MPDTCVSCNPSQVLVVYMYMSNNVTSDYVMPHLGLVVFPWYDVKYHVSLGTCNALLAVDIIIILCNSHYNQVW